MNALVLAYGRIRDEVTSSLDDENHVKALLILLALWISRLSARCNSVCRWFPGREAIQSPFSGQSIPMMWDYPEVNPFSSSPAGAREQLQRMIEVLRREEIDDAPYRRPTFLLGSATKLLLDDEACDCVVTDPPYGQAIAYADLSDFFYVWLKRMIGVVLPEVFATPQTPKAEEATSHKHRHNGSAEGANRHYKTILTASFREILRVTREPKLVSVMFAHQSSEAWSALLGALFDAGLCPDATWPIATEMPNAALGLDTASLESSVTVVCRPRARLGRESFKVVERQVREVVQEAVNRFWGYGLRGADLVVACYGPAVGVFGRFDRVERGDGSIIGVPELLSVARQAARDAIAGEFRGDELSTLYYVWATLYGASEQQWDDARMVVQIGGKAEGAMELARERGIFVVDRATCRLALFADRGERKSLGADPGSPLIDMLHRSMRLWKLEKRPELLAFLGERQLIEDGPFWKLAQALFDVLPRDSEDWKLISTLLGERDTLHREQKAREAARSAAMEGEAAAPRLPLE
jgi:adenine-specific DNA methylase